METIRLPLLHDHHTHPLLYASLQAAVNLEPVQDKAAATKLLRGREQNSTGQLLLAYGWRSNLFEWTEDDLESFGPLAIFNLSLHALKVNRAGREALRQRYGDDVDRIEDQDWYENNFRQVLNWFAVLHATEQNLKSFYRYLETLGVYSAEELLLVNEEEIELFQAAGLADRTKFWVDPNDFVQLSEASQEMVTGLKLFTDGAIGARTAALSEGYLGAPNHRGMLVYTDQELTEIVDRCLATSKQLAVHAIGDLAIEQIIGVLEQVGMRHATDVVRIEHAQLISREVAIRGKNLGLTLSMQPNFSNDSVHYADRISQRYCQMNNPFRMLIDEVGFQPGKDLIFGSDGMPHGAANALHQCLVSGLPHQRVAVEEFVAAYGGDESLGTFEVELLTQEDAC